VDGTSVRRIVDAGLDGRHQALDALGSILGPDDALGDPLDGGGRSASLGCDDAMFFISSSVNIGAAATLMV